MKLILTSSGRVLARGDDVVVVHGVRANAKDNTISISEIVDPCPAHPEGLIKYNVHNDGIPSYQAFLPYVIGAIFVKDTG